LSLFPAISGPPEMGSYYPSWWTTSVGALQDVCGIVVQRNVHGLLMLVRI
jgi:hypothetical protein